MSKLIPTSSERKAPVELSIRYQFPLVLVPKLRLTAKSVLPSPSKSSTALAAARGEKAKISAVKIKRPDSVLACQARLASEALCMCCPSVD
jgi:hypothetical protein